MIKKKYEATKHQTSPINPIDGLNNMIAATKDWLTQLEKAKTEIQECKLKVGQPAYHSHYKTCLILGIDFYDEQSSNLKTGTYAKIAHVQTDNNDGGNIDRVLLHELLPYNDSVKALYE